MKITTRHGDGAAALQQPSDSSSKGLLNTETLEAATLSRPQAQAATPGSPILARLRRDWGMEFYIRVDRRGSFHTYPDVGGPFQSLQQAEDAIDRYLHGRRDSTMCVDQSGVSRKEMGIHRCLYWPDGTQKRRTKSLVLERALEHTCRLVRAVVDQYNEDHNLLGDVAYELKEVVHHESFREKKKSFHHVNFTAKTKGTDGLDYRFDNLFFAELANTKQEGSHGEWAVTCFCMVEPVDNGNCCGCPNDMKHPNNADAYVGGHVGADELFGLPAEWSDSDEDWSSKERRIRRMYKGRKRFVVPAWAAPMDGEDEH